MMSKAFRRAAAEPLACRWGKTNQSELDVLNAKGNAHDRDKTSQSRTEMALAARHKSETRRKRTGLT